MREEAVVLAHEEMRLHDAQRVKRHADDDEERRAAEERGNRPRKLHPAHQNHRDERHHEKARAADERNLRHHVVKILGRRAPRADARDVRTVLLQVLGDVDRVELRRHPEEREEHDRHRVDHHVERSAGIAEVRRELVQARARLGELHENRGRDRDERLREDDRHDARVVHAKRHERLLHAVGVAARDAAARRVDRHLAHALRQHHRAHDDEDEEDHHDRKLGDRRGRLDAGKAEVTLPRANQRLRKTRGDVDHDDQRGTIADAERRNLVGEPHDEERRGRHANHRHQLEADSGIRHDLDALERLAEHARMTERGRNAPRLHDAEDDRQVTRDLRKLLTAGLALLLQLLERGDDGREELDHDLRRDVGPDREEADRALAERTAREHLEHVEQAAALVLRLEVGDNVLQSLPVNAGRRNLRNETAHENEAERNQDFLTEFRNSEHVRKALHHRHDLLFSFTMQTSFISLYQKPHGRATGSGCSA